MTYHDTYRKGPNWPVILDHDWRKFTHNRLTWLYGEDYAEARQAMREADLAAWNSLGVRREH